MAITDGHPTAYPARTDLQIPRVAPGQPYGEATAQRNALRAVPIPTQPQQGTIGSPGPAAPAQVVPLSEPTQNPNEPLTAGAPFGPGPGPEALGPGGAALMGQPQDPVRQQVAALYQVNPNPDLLRLLQLLDAQGR